jgi:hypothetical protein
LTPLPHQQEAAADGDAMEADENEGDALARETRELLGFVARRVLPREAVTWEDDERPTGDAVLEAAEAHVAASLRRIAEAGGQSDLAAYVRGGGGVDFWVCCLLSF